MEQTRPGEYMPVYENERGTYIFNSKDLNMIEYIDQILDAGIDSLKIEGRMKTALYVATVARTYRKAIDDCKESVEKYRANMDYYKEEIAKCTYRQFTTGFYFGKTDERMYTELTTDHPIDLCRYQVANGYMGRVGLINSGGESHGASDLKDAVVTAVVNKRAGGMGLISGRKAFQKPMNKGVELLNAIQDVYLDPSITIA